MDRQSINAITEFLAQYNCKVDCIMGDGVLIRNQYGKANWQPKYKLLLGMISEYVVTEGRA